MATYYYFFLVLWGFVPHLFCSGMQYVDLSHDVGEDSLHWPADDSFTFKVKTKGYTPEGYWYETYSFCIGEHISTHLDAPSHFAENKWTIEQIPLSHLIGPGVVVDMEAKVTQNPTAELTTDDLMAWLEEHGPLPDGVIIFVRTGWDKRYGNKTEYFGTDTNDTNNLVFPGISTGAAQLLVGYEAATGRRIVGVGLDTPSLDHGPSKKYETHQTLFEANIYGIEYVANLNKLPTTGFQVWLMPMKLRGGSGAPVRIVAILPEDSAAASTSAILGTLILLVVSFSLYFSTSATS